jgi:hypothetical protein
LLGGRAAWVPHVEVGDELATAFERVEQTHRAGGADQRGAPVDLHHRQSPSSGGERVRLMSVGLLPGAEDAELSLERIPVGRGRCCGGLTDGRDARPGGDFMISHAAPILVGVLLL